MKKNKKKQLKINRDLTMVNGIYVGLAVLVNILVILTIFNVTRYSAISKAIFILLNIGALIALLALNLGLIVMIRTKKVNVISVVSVLLVVLLIGGGYGAYATSSINSNVARITGTDSGNTTESLDTSFVVYGDSKITSLTDVNGKIVGLVPDTQYGTLGKEELTANSMSVTYKEYQDYIQLSLALFSGDVDMAVLPSNYISLLDVNEGLAANLEETTAIHTFEKVVKKEVVQGSGKDITAEPFTVLIIGVDEGRSDALMVASVNPISMTITLTSIARDSYVPIACYAGQGSDKINHARARSRECTIKTVENLLDIDIDFYFESNFKGIVQMVDAVGGITIYNEREFVGQDSSSTRGKMTVYVPGGGYVHLNGEQALTFARERHLYANGDFQRQMNQQQVISAMLREVMRSKDINKFIAVLNAAGENVSTNFSTDQMVAFVQYAMKKTARYYDEDHYERIFDIQSSRITGYNSGILNEATQTSIYIYRLFEGSIKDTREAILRNLNLATTIDAPKSIQWNREWATEGPTIGQIVYNEPRVAQEVPETLANYVGRPIGNLQSWAKIFDIKVNIRYIGENMAGFDASLKDGTIIKTDIAVGTNAADFTEINVDVIQRGSNGTDEVTGNKVSVRYINKSTNEEITTLAYSEAFKNGDTYSVTIQPTGYQAVTAADITVVGTTTANAYTFASGKVSGKMLESDIQFTVKVTPTAATHTLTIQYINESGTVLRSDTVLLAQGVQYTIVPPAITGYIFAGIYEGTTSGANVTMGSTNITVKAKYKAAYVLTIKYLDESGRSLQDATTVSLANGATYNIVAPSISGYEVKTYESTTSGTSVTMGAGPKTVTVRYKATSTATYVLTIQYLDESGGSLQNATTVSLANGATYNIVAPSISGYEVKAYEGTTSDASVTMGAEPKTVVVRYKLKAVATYTLTIQYVSETGVTLGSDTVQLAQGATYTITPKPFSGYTATGVYNNTTSGASVTMGAEPKTVVVKYRADVTEPSTSPNP